MNKVELMKRITDAGKYCKLRIDADGEITGMLVDEDFHTSQPPTQADAVLSGNMAMNNQCVNMRIETPKN